MDGCDRVWENGSRVKLEKSSSSLVVLIDHERHNSQSKLVNLCILIKEYNIIITFFESTIMWILFYKNELVEI